MAGAEVIPRYNTGRRYDFNRQTPEVEYSYYMDLKFRRNPEAFYIRPDTAPEVEFVEKLSESRYAVVHLIKWESQYTPQNPDFAIRYRDYVETQTVWAIYSKSKIGNRGAVVVSHSWTTGDIFKDRHYNRDKMFDLMDLGYDTIVIQQPYQGLRSLENTVFSGEPLLSGDISLINESMCQSVTDIRSMLNWLSTDYEVVGLMGEDMGATASLLTVVVDGRPDFVVAWNPPGSLGEINADSALAPFAIETMRAAGIDQILAEKVLYVASPANYDPQIPVEDVIVFAGMGDEFVKPEQPESLLYKWDGLEIVWYSGGRIMNFQKKMCRRKEEGFLVSKLPADSAR